MDSTYGLCQQCKVELTTLDICCPSCNSHVGFPNVVLAELTDEVESLDERFLACKNSVATNNLAKPFEELQQAVEDHGRVVVAMPIHVVLTLLVDDKNQYTGYEKLVGSGVRRTGSFANDTHRKVVAGALFGTFGESIIYGSLSLSGRGLNGYGDVFCTLRSQMVEARTSFLEVNSYDFVEEHGTNQLPKGYRANWSRKSKLVAVKFQEAAIFDEKHTISDWESLLIESKSKKRNEDVFVEAHIFGTFNRHSIQHMQKSDSIDKSDRKLADELIARFSNG